MMYSSLGSHQLMWDRLGGRGGEGDLDMAGASEVYRLIGQLLRRIFITAAKKSALHSGRLLRFSGLTVSGPLLAQQLSTCSLQKYRSSLLLLLPFFFLKRACC
jgi:hypothetical protein